MPKFTATDLQGNWVGAMLHGFPINGSITQVFAQVSITGSRHGGMDLAPSHRSHPVSAPAPGRVWGAIPASAGYAFGNWVCLDHGDGLYSAYAHLSQMTVSQGDEVGLGTLLGYTGNTGLSYGEHLHWAVGSNPWFALTFAELYDPAIFISQEEDDMTPEQLASFELMRNVLFRWGIPGICRPGTEDLFPPGTPVFAEGAEPPADYTWPILRNWQAEEYCKRRGFAFGLSLLGHQITHPGPSLDALEPRTALMKQEDAFGLSASYPVVGYPEGYPESVLGPGSGEVAATEG